MNENKGIMPTKIELTLEQSQQGVSDDVLVNIEGVEELKRNKAVMDPVMQCTTLPSHSSFSQKKLVSFVTEIHIVILFSTYSDEWKSFQSQHQTALRYKRRCCSPIPAKSDSLPHAHTQAFKVNHSASRLLILNFFIIKEPQSKIKNSLLGKIWKENQVLPSLALWPPFYTFGPRIPSWKDLENASKESTKTRTTPATTTTTTPMTDEQLKALSDQGVADALAARDADRSKIMGLDSGTGGRRQAPPTRECTYSGFLKCQPLNFKDNEGVVGLTQWFEKMESVFHISNCTVVCQIKFATCTLQGNALTWWNSHVKTVTHEVAYAMTWKTLKKMMSDKYSPRGKTKKLEIKMMYPEESDEIEKYVGGLPDMIHGSVMASKPKTIQDAIEFATELMDQKIRTLAERQAENKRKLDNNNQAQQQPPKKQGVAIAYTDGSGEMKEYDGTLPETSLAMNVGIKGTTGVIAQS
ncbi:reverse transcriptase domain-containing protein [Tanacetum coccineum]|uniref:Reverse transcriptase domain-containing protein n=1 Tax=Tanacetum coccineum TaxID=301880 RepID=A0ABQ4YDB6_9ASTR